VQRGARIEDVPADNSVERSRGVALTVFATLVGAVLGASLGGGIGFLVGSLLCYVVGREFAIRGRLRRLNEVEAQLSSLQVWAKEMKAWAEQAYARLSERPTPDADTTPDTDVDASETLAPPDPATRAPGPTPTPAEPTPAEGSPLIRFLDHRDAAEPEPEPAGAEPEPAAPTAAAPEPAGPAPAPATPTEQPEPVSAVAEPRVSDDAAGPAPGAPPRQPLAPVARLVGAAKAWITTGNAPVKVGVLVSLIGVGLLLREASRRGVINITLEMRLIAVALFGLALLAIGWRLRRKNPIYGVSLQGGGVAVLYLTTFASFAVYDVLPVAPAAVAVILVTVGAGFLSVLQDSPPLAVLGIIGGFLAPVLTYTSPHDHIWVFGFYAVLSAAIVAVAWFKTWPLLNLLGLGFTFGIAAFWLWRRFDEDKWHHVQPLIGVLILLYLVIPVLFAIRQAPDLRRPSTAPLVFGTPFLGFGLQYLAVGHTTYGMAVSAAALALVHGVLALVAHGLGRECRSLAEANVGLGVAFAVIAVPLAFDAHLTAVVWAAQGGLLAWIGCRRVRVSAAAAGAVLQMLGGAVLAGHLVESLPYTENTLLVANQFFLGAAVLAGAGLVTGRMVHALRNSRSVDAAVPWFALAWGTGWWMAGGLIEIGNQAASHHQLAVSLCFVVLSFGAAWMFADRLRWPHLHGLGVAIGPAMWAAAVVSLISQPLHPLDRFGWAAWPVSLVVFYSVLRSGESRFLRTGDERFQPLAGALHGAAYWLLVLLVVTEVYWQTDRAAEGVWLIVAPAAAGTALAAAVLLGRRLRWPVQAHRRVYLEACAGPTLLLAGTVMAAAGLLSAGSPSPLPFVPVLNPLMVLLAALAGLGFRWVAVVRPQLRESSGERSSLGVLAVGAGAVAVATMELARTIHHWRDVPWDPEAMIKSTAFGASLTIMWALIAAAAMVVGARSGRRAAWVGGGCWMAIVVVKLVAFDLSNLTPPGRATAFIAVGVLLLLIGYVAPVAPRASAETDAPAGTGADWLTGGNWPVTVGAMVSLVGAGLLLTADAGQDLLESSIETRLTAVTAAAAVMLAIGWIQRRVRPIFGATLQGGGIAMLHIAVYAGHSVHGVFGAAPAGAAVMAVTAGAVVLAIIQDSRALAVLATVGGFLAPVLTYTGSDDHVLLFGFYTVLSAAIVTVAWFKAWPELNLLGLVSAFGIGAWWLEFRFDPDDWMVVQPFIAALVLLYMSIPAISSRRGAPETPEMWMHPLVFGTPFAALGMQQLLVGHIDYAMAISALALALLLAALLAVVRGLGTANRELTATYAGLSTVFVAIAVPLALDGAYGATVWAAQGSLLVWVGCRRGGLLPIAGGGVLQALAGGWFAVHLPESLPYGPDVAVVVNEYVMAAAVLAVAGFVSGWRVHLASERVAINPAAGWLVLAWSAAWWLAGGLVEIVSQIPEHWLPASLSFVVASSGAAVAVAGPLRWRRLDALGVLIPPALLTALGVSLATLDHPLDRFGWAAWPASLVIAYGCLRRCEPAVSGLAAGWHAARGGEAPGSDTTGGPVPVAAALHAAGFWIVVVLATTEIRWQIDQIAGDVWTLVVTTAAAMSLAAAPMGARRRLVWPFDSHWRTYTLACSGPLLLVLSLVVIGAAAFSDGDAAPLVFLPAANPLGVLVGVQLLVLLVWKRHAGEQSGHPFKSLVDARWSPTLFGLGVVLATAETARTVSHWLDVPWDLEPLWESSALQTSLSILWAVIGLSGMVAGVRMVRRAVWVAGASWMAVVVAKLFLVDLRNLTALGRVVSFIVVGVLLLIVGYLAPVPPAASEDNPEQSGD
jgi:uncharacterized membrane protein